MEKSYTLTAVGPAEEVLDAGEGFEWSNLNMKVNGGADDTQVSLEVSQNGTDWASATHAHGGQLGGEWAEVASDVHDRYTRPNVLVAGTDVTTVTVIVTGTSVPAFD